MRTKFHIMHNKYKLYWRCFFRMYRTFARFSGRGLQKIIGHFGLIWKLRESFWPLLRPLEAKTAYMTLFSWVLNDFKLSGPFLASWGRKRGQKWNFSKNLHTVCSLDSKEHPDLILKFYYVRCARKCLHKDWTSVVFQFSNFKTRIFAFFSIFSKTKWSRKFYIPKLSDKPKMPNTFL